MSGDSTSIDANRQAKALIEAIGFSDISRAVLQNRAESDGASVVAVVWSFPKRGRANFGKKKLAGIYRFFACSLHKPTQLADDVQHWVLAPEAPKIAKAHVNGITVCSARLRRQPLALDLRNEYIYREIDERIQIRRFHAGVLHSFRQTCDSIP